MHLLPEKSSRRETVIAGLAAAMVGIAMVAIAGKASAMPADPDGTATTRPTSVDEPPVDRPMPASYSARPARIMRPSRRPGAKLHRRGAGSADR